MLHITTIAEQVGNVITVRWECSCGVKGKWLTSRPIATRNGRKHETARNAAQL